MEEHKLLLHRLSSTNPNDEQIQKLVKQKLDVLEKMDNESKALQQKLKEQILQTLETQFNDNAGMRQF